MTEISPSHDMYSGHDLTAPDLTALPRVNDLIIELEDACAEPREKSAASERTKRRYKSRRANLRSINLPQQLLEANQPLVLAEGNAGAAYRIFKRVGDFVGALALLVVLGPVMLVVWAILMVTTHGKPIFAQTRIGYLGRPFRMYKFRTMRLDAEKVQHLVQNEKDGPIFKNKHDPRITKLGRWLRKTSIDELPQLFNVLKGQMSLVGPRPAIAREVLSYKAWQRRRLSVMPGLTCLWQVSGRSDVSFEEWMRLDLRYLRKQTFMTDVKLLLKTPMAVIFGRGAC